jgi:drug/metabolite transporter (DMT)-like permease
MDPADVRIHPHPRHGWGHLEARAPNDLLGTARPLGAARLHRVLPGGTRFPLGAGGAWAAATAVCAAASLILLFFALTKGEASTVVPAGSAYPVVTLIGSALFLSESITVARIAGTLLIVAGVVLLSR